MVQIGDCLKDILYLIVYGLPYEEYKEYKSMLDGKKEHGHVDKPKTFGEELHEIATPIHEEYKEKLKKLREIREDQYKHYAEIVFDNTKEQLLEEANNGRFRYTVLEEDIKNMLRDKGFGGIDTDDLVEALRKLGETKGIEVFSKEYLKDLVEEDNECEEDEYETWVVFEW